VQQIVRPASLDPPKDEAAFQAERRSGIGGSDAAVILGLSSWMTPLELWMRKTGRAAETPDSPILRRGRKLEAIVASEYEEETGRKVTAAPGFVVHPEHSWMIGHVDRIIPPTNGFETPGILECKSANVFRLSQWEDEAPLAAQVQLMHYLAVTGYKWGSVAGLLGGIDFKYQDIQRNEDFIGKLIEKERSFWLLVQIDTPPEPTAADTKTLNKLYAAVTGQVIELPAEAELWDQQRLTAKMEIDRLKDLLDEAEARLKFAIGAGEAGRLPDGTVYTFKEQQRKEYVCAATSFRVLRRAGGAK
jgi:putative phage-type endonuclease